MPFSQRTDWQDLEAGGTPIYAADLLRIEQGIKDNETAAATGANHATGDGSDHADVALNSSHRSSAHAPANADNTAANETSHTAEAAHRTGNGSDHADVAANSAAIAALGSYTVTPITGTDTCTMDLAGKRSGFFTFAKTVPVTLALINPPDGAWGAILEITDDGGGDSVSYPAGWLEIGGAALSVTTGGIDRWYISGNGSADIRVSQTLDWRAS
jgi:hypothetical protein